MNRLVIFAKAPVPGKVKTRLVPPLTYEQAAEMYKGWAQEIFKTASGLDSARPVRSHTMKHGARPKNFDGNSHSQKTSNGVKIEIAYESHPDFPEPKWLSKNGIPIPFFLQKGENLGERLIHAFQRAFIPHLNPLPSRGEGGGEGLKVVIIGSDSPGLPLDYLRQSFEALEKNDLVLGPAQDGGYYLIGLRNKIVPELFRDIPWSTSRVFSETLTVAEKLNLRTHLLPEYFDVDTGKDLKKQSMHLLQETYL